jgi:hypothetical protein
LYALHQETGGVKGHAASFCNQCGSEVPDGARFCQNCGAALHIAAGASGEATPGQFPTAPPLPTASAPLPPPYPYQPAPFAPPPYPVGPGQAFASQRSGKATAGFWLGIMSIVPGILMTWVGILLGILGIVFSAIALSEMNRFASQFPDVPPQGKRQAQIGIALSIVGIVCSTIFLIYLLNNLERYGIKITTP